MESFSCCLYRRSAMSRPSDVLSKLSAPNAQYPEYALRFRDFRFNFCINNGSETFPSVIPIYKSVYLDAQLDMVSSFYAQVFIVF